MGGGRLRRPPLIKYQFYIQKMQKIQKHDKNQMTHTKIQQNQMTDYIC